ncbi:MAG: hypothetical protein AB2807_03420 [Candidatus Sedimenticola endophacoides]
MKDFGTSQSPKSTRQHDSRYCPDRPALITTPSRTLQQSCSCATAGLHPGSQVLRCPTTVPSGKDIGSLRRQHQP